MRGLVCWPWILLVPLSIFAADTPAGVVYGTGAVYLNGSQLSSSMPAMLGDIIETKDTSTAHVDIPGSTAIVQPNAIVRFRDGGFALDRGAISVATGKQLKVFARDFEITPTSTNWTQFEVERSAGLIHISAVKFDVEIKCGAQAPTIIREGHHLTRADAQNCGLAEKEGGAPSAASGPILGTRVAEGVGAAVAGGLLGWTLDHGDDPISPDGP
ncbi:MAG TPA: hypothetical protein VLW06_01130 [Terriglobales bacterium]|nr:hypothetical protein [Terriglobales bacterium]